MAYIKQWLGWIIVGAGVLASANAIRMGWMAYSKWEGSKKELIALNAKMEKLEAEKVSQDALRYGMAPIPQDEFVKLTALRFQAVARSMGEDTVTIGRLGRGPAKSIAFKLTLANKEVVTQVERVLVHNVSPVEGSLAKVLEFMYRLRKSMPPSVPSVFSVRRSPKGVSGSLTFETPGKEWPRVEPRLAIDLALARVFANSGEALRDPYAAVPIIGIGTPTGAGGQKSFQLKGILKTEKSVEILLASKGTDENEEEYTYHKDKSNVLGWRLDCSPYLSDTKVRMVLLRKGEKKLEWREDESFDGKEITAKPSSDSPGTP